MTGRDREILEPLIGVSIKGILNCPKEALLISRGTKEFATRGRSTNYRGLVFICSEATEDDFPLDPPKTALIYRESQWIKKTLGRLPTREDLAVGVCYGVAELVDVGYLRWYRTRGRLRTAYDKAQFYNTVGQRGWRFANVQPLDDYVTFPEIARIGTSGLFDVRLSDEVLS